MPLNYDEIWTRGTDPSIINAYIIPYGEIVETEEGGRSSASILRLLILDNRKKDMISGGDYSIGELDSNVEMLKNKLTQKARIQGADRVYYIRDVLPLEALEKDPKDLELPFISSSSSSSSFSSSEPR
jgi:hypothetical protein